MFCFEFNSFYDCFRLFVHLKRSFHQKFPDYFCSDEMKPKISNSVKNLLKSLKYRYDETKFIDQKWLSQILSLVWHKLRQSCKFVLTNASAQTRPDITQTSPRPLNTPHPTPRHHPDNPQTPPRHLF